MANKKLAHNSLGLGSFNSQKTQTILIDIDMSVPKKLKFKYASWSAAGDPDSMLPAENDFLSPKPTDLLDIKIEEDCYVQMWLVNQNLDWYWRSEDAITTTESVKSIYKQLEYYHNGGWVTNPGEKAKCHGIRFGAVFRGGNPTDDPFNMNFMLEWGPDEVLPVTIDPDIQNPRA
jgi:hypothetical protein